jgi:predicted ferric reductase
VRHVGLDRLVIWHRLNGKLCLGLILAHIVLITIGYAQFDHISITAEVSALLGTYPYMVRATIGTGLLILVVGTSLLIVRRYLRYEAWYFVHLTAYLAVLLGWYQQLHPFSLSEAPDSQSLRITIKISGDFTRTISTVTPGTRVLAEGPFGHLTDAVRHREGVALIAGGIGITPMRALLEEMPGDVVLIYRAAQEDEILFRDEFDRLVRTRGVRVYFVTGDHRAPGNERLMTTEHLRELVPDLDARDVYLCGPPAMMDVIERNVEAAGVPPKYIHTERFAV